MNGNMHFCCLCICNCSFLIFLVVTGASSLFFLVFCLQTCPPPSPFFVCGVGTCTCHCLMNGVSVISAINCGVSQLSVLTLHVQFYISIVNKPCQKIQSVPNARDEWLASFVQVSVDQYGFISIPQNMHLQNFDINKSLLKI